MEKISAQSDGNRRTFLKSLGGTAGLLALGLRSQKAHADTIDPKFAVQFESTRKYIIDFFNDEKGGAAFLASLVSKEQKQSFVFATLLAIESVYTSNTKTLQESLHNGDVLFERMKANLPTALQQFRCQTPFSNADLLAAKKILQLLASQSGLSA